MAEESEEYARYKYAMENIHDVIWELDRKLSFTFISPNTKELSGYKPDEMIGRNILDFLSDESRAYVSEGMKKTFRNGSTVR